MHQGCELNAFALWHGSFKSWNATIGRFRLASDTGDQHHDHGGVIDWDRVTTESMLNDVAEHEGSHRRHTFELRHGFAEVFFFQVIQIKAVELFKDRLKNGLQTLSGFVRIWKTRQNGGQLSHRGDADFVPIEIVLLQLRQAFVGQISGAIFEQAGIQRVFEERTRRGGGGHVVVFFQSCLQLCNQFRAVSG